ncbi:MAG: ligase-associated DNA damage response endonuclease PdeM [Beijerinckiaceae bacterium]
MQQTASASSACPPAELDQAMAVIRIAGYDLLADLAGALFWPEERMIIVADMHLEKGSFYAARGQMLPPYDSAVTLASLTRIIARYRPARLVALGDSFHDTRACERMGEDCQEVLRTLAKNVEMVWITGNHDPEIPSMLPGTRLHELAVGSLMLRHEPMARAHVLASRYGEIAGHLHPAARIVTDRGRTRRKSFVSDTTRIVMPAFGAFTGGLNLLDPAIRLLFERDAFEAHVCGKTRIYTIAPDKLRPD